MLAAPAQEMAPRRRAAAEPAPDTPPRLPTCSMTSGTMGRAGAGSVLPPSPAPCARLGASCQPRGPLSPHPVRRLCPSPSFRGCAPCTPLPRHPVSSLPGLAGRGGASQDHSFRGPGSRVQRAGLLSETQLSHLGAHGTRLGPRPGPRLTHQIHRETGVLCLIVGAGCWGRLP